MKPDRLKLLEEAYFPNVDEFFYDWEDLVDEKYKWGFFSKNKITGVGKNHNYNYYKQKMAEDVNNIINAIGTDCNYIHLWKFKHAPIFNKYHSHFVFKLKPRKKQDIYADIIISPRNRTSRGENNFLKWDKIISILNKKGYNVGCVGSKNQSLYLPESKVNSWDYDDNGSAVIELLSKCKLYIGLDTGVSHLAAFMSIPMIVFSHSNQRHYLTHFMRELNKNYFLDLGKRITNVSIIIKNAIKFLGGRKWK